MNNVEKKQLAYGDVLVVGIDIAKRVHWARVLGPMGVDVIMPFKFHNTREGFIRLESKINEARKLGIKREYSELLLAWSLQVIIGSL